MIPGSTNQLLAAGVGYQISRSVRLRSSASAFFSKAAVGTSTNALWTYSIWVKRGSLGTNMELLSAASGSTNYSAFFFNSTDNLVYQERSGATTYTQLITTQVFRDPSAWYHIVLAYDSANATAANRVRIFVNGAQVTNFSTATYPSTIQNSYISWTGSTLGDFIGRFGGAATEYLDGYITEINFVTGQALTPSSFGETDIFTGVWKPKKYVGTYGTNGFYLNFSDPSAATAAAIGKDYSGNGNNWTPNNISVTAGATYDSMLDVPTPWGDGGNGRGNYAVLNPLDIGQTSTLTNANLTFTTSSTTNYSINRGTISVNTGKWYWEFTMTAATAANGVGIARNNAALNNYLGADANGYGWQGSAGSVYNNGSGTSYNGGATFTNNDVIGVALDMDAGTLTFYKNGVSQGTAASSLTGEWFPAVSDMSSSSTASIAANFGQRPFAYTPPSGFRALNTLNLPTPTILKGNQYFDVNTWTGNASTQSIVNSGAMQPDLVWAKARSGTAGGTGHIWQDAVRGLPLYLQSNTTAAEASAADHITSFNSNGFSMGAGGSINAASTTYVGWQWKEGATQGFDIVTYTGTGSNTTIAHNLGVAPRMMIVKRRSGASDWIVWHSTFAGTEYIALNTTAAKVTGATIWNSTSPTSSVFSVGTSGATNGNTDTYVAYLFSEVAGFSRFGSYTGNGSTDGPMVFTGFLPRWVLIKCSSAAGTGWYVYDTVRNTYNVMDLYLRPDVSDAETTFTAIDCLSNGFKLRTSNSQFNGSGSTYVYAAFASSPFKNSLAR